MCVLHGVQPNLEKQPNIATICIMSATQNLTSVDWDAAIGMKQLFDVAPVAIAVVSAQGTLLYINEKLAALFGYDRTELIGQPVELLMPERFRQAHIAHRQGYMQTPYMRTMGAAMDLVARRADGTEFPIEAGLSHVRLGNQDGGQAGQQVVIVTINDISRRKQTEEVLEQRVEVRTRELERRRLVADSLREILALLNSNRPLQEILDYVGAQACQLFDADATFFYARDPRSGRLTPPANHNMTDQELAAIEGSLDLLAATHVLDAGAPVAVPSAASNVKPPDMFSALLAVPLPVKGEMYGALIICYNQVREFSTEDTDLAKTLGDQTALVIQNARLHMQIERTAVAAERNRLARDLHDSVTQTLFSASMIAEVLPRIWTRDAVEGRRRLDELRELTRGALAEMRTLLLELRPAKLAEVEIADLLRQLAEAIAGRTRVPIAVDLDGEAQLPVDVKIALYRIAQEALNNVAKHAQANQAEVTLTCKPKDFKLTVRDDGVGFVFDTIKPAHLGLGIMRERAEDIGATLVVQSSPGTGTRIEVRWRPTRPS